MSYTATVWDSDTLISARLLRNAEDQYAQAKSYLDAHTHDDRYFTETEADLRFFHLDGGNDTLPAGLDADTIDGSHASDLIGDALPAGAIMIWYNTDGDVPSGWSICTGAGDTPDLRDKFIVGAGDTYAVTDSGGVASVTPGEGSITVAGHALTAAETPRHRHEYYDYYGTPGTCVPLGSQLGLTVTTVTDLYTGYTGESTPDAHGHTGSTFAAAGALDNRPPYFALYYIQKVS